MGVVRRRVVVSGRVQGVFFRVSARDVANSNGVAGRAVNRDDGSVELELEGEPAAVDRVIAWASQGPARALVTSVDVVELTPTGRRGFSTR